MARYKALKLKYRAIQEQNEKDLGELTKELDLKSFSPADALLKLSEYKETLSQLQEQVKQQQQTIGWYRDTYELRSFLGVLKEKLRQRNKKEVVQASTAS